MRRNKIMSTLNSYWRKKIFLSMAPHEIKVHGELYNGNH
jgi:hypothetical protein